jgi:hypothetical protein
MNSRQKVAFWTDAVSHSHHEIKGVNIWLVFIGLIALKIQKNIFFINRLNRL